jgi:myo-inosose-2 dehydratase
MIRIGANPIGWSNDDMLEVGGNIPLEQCLSEARAAGFVGMELGNKFPRRVSQLRPILEAHGLVLVSGWYSCELLVRDVTAEMQAAQAHIDLLKGMGCGVMIVAETSNAIHCSQSTPLSARPVMAKSDWAEFATRLTAFGERLDDQGLRLVYHHHMGTIVQSEADIDRMMEETGDAVHLLLDTGHATWGGADPARLARHYKARISHVHCKDVREDAMWEANRKDLSFGHAVLGGVYTVPGDGLVDFPGVLRELKGYSGWVVVEAEQDPEKANPARYAKMGYANLRRFVSAAGLEG